jgi:hypothetical protein
MLDSGSEPFEVPFVDGRTEFKVTDPSIDMSGYYSVDYANGKLYLEDRIDAGASGNLEFQYTTMYACYNAARVVDSNEYSVDPVSKTISISNREILRVWGSLEPALKKEALLKIVYKYISKTRESLTELEPYFTPIVREYALKVLCEGTF